MSLHAVFQMPGSGMSLSCPPVVENEPALTVTAPAGSGPRAGTRLLNLDKNDKLVKKGVVVSYYGLRYLVVKVRMGRCVGSELSPWGVPRRDARMRLVCESVQVVG